MRLVANLKELCEGVEKPWQYPEWKAATAIVELVSVLEELLDSRGKTDFEVNALRAKAGDLIARLKQ